MKIKPHLCFDCGGGLTDAVNKVGTPFRQCPLCAAEHYEVSGHWAVMRQPAALSLSRYAPMDAGLWARVDFGGHQYEFTLSGAHTNEDHTHNGFKAVDVSVDGVVLSKGARDLALKNRLLLDTIIEASGRWFTEKGWVSK